MSADDDAYAERLAEMRYRHAQLEQNLAEARYRHAQLEVGCLPPPWVLPGKISLFRLCNKQRAEIQILHMAGALALPTPLSIAVQKAKCGALRHAPVAQGLATTPEALG